MRDHGVLQHAMIPRGTLQRASKRCPQEEKEKLTAELKEEKEKVRLLSEDLVASRADARLAQDRCVELYGLLQQLYALLQRAGIEAPSSPPQSTSE